MLNISFSAQGASKRGGKTRIRSDLIDIKRKSQTINFLNNVVVEKGEDSLLADKMTVIYDEDNAKAKGSKIKRIDAKGNVKIFSEDFVASADLGHYDPQKNMFFLEQNVIVNNGTSIASGDKFIYNLAKKKGKFVGQAEETSIMNNDGKKSKRITVIIGNDKLKK